MLTGLLLTLALGPSPASFAPAPSIAVEVDRCLQVDPAELDAALELELGAGPKLSGGPGKPGDTRLLVDCGADGAVELTVIDPLASVTLTRTLPDSSDAADRTQRLAEYGAGLIRAAWFNLAVERPEARRRTRSEATAARVADRPAAPWALGDGFVVRSFLADDSPRLMLGEQVEVVHRPLRHLAWKADGELAYWRVPIDDGDQTGEVRTLSISAAPALLGWGEIPGHGPRGAGTVALYGGAGFRVGGVRMRSATLGDSGGFRSYVGPLAQVRASVSLGRFVGLAVNVEAGWLIHGPERPNGVPLSLRGPWTNGVIVIVSRF